MTAGRVGWADGAVGAEKVPVGRSGRGVTVHRSAERLQGRARRLTSFGAHPKSTSPQAVLAARRLTSFGAHPKSTSSLRSGRTAAVLLRVTASGTSNVLHFVGTPRGAPQEYFSLRSGRTADAGPGEMFSMKRKAASSVTWSALNTFNSGLRRIGLAIGLAMAMGG